MLHLFLESGPENIIRNQTTIVNTIQSTLSPKRVALICGVSGQDGSYLAKLLLDKAYTVIGTARDAHTSTFNNLKALGISDRVKCVSMAPNDFRSVLHVLAQHTPDEIYNLAGQTSVGLSFEQPVETLESISIATLNLLEGIRFLRRKIRFYNAASGECFGDTGQTAADEDTPFRPRSPYAVAKSAAFWQVANYREAYGLFACSGILFNHESPFRPERFVTQKIIRSACRIARGSDERLLLGNLEVARDWGWAPEYVNAMWLMLQTTEARDYVIATGQTFSLRDFVAAAFSSLDMDWREYVEVRPEFYRPSEIMSSRANAERARTELGWRAGAKMPEVVKLMISDIRDSC